MKPDTWGPSARFAMAPDAATSSVRNDSVWVTSSDSAAMRKLFDLPSAGSVVVNDRTAMQVSTVYACLNKLAGAITQLPIHQYRMQANGERERMSNTPLWWLLNESPSPAWTAAAWKEWIVRCVVFRGDQHTEIVRNGPAIAGLLVHHPDSVNARAVGDRLVYDVMGPDGKARGVDQDDMLHFTGMGFDGVRSLSVISHAARQAISNSLSAGSYSGKTLAPDAMPPNIALSYQTKKFSDDQLTEFLRNFRATYGGNDGFRYPLVLTDGGDVKQLSISPVDLQLMEARRFEREDICQAMGVPPIIIGESEKTSSWGTGVEQIILGFVRFTIKPHLVRWEEELNRKFFRRAGQFVEFEIDGLLRGDSKSQAEYFRAALGGPGTGDGWMTIDEVRRLKNLPPAAGGDTLFKAAAKPALAPAAATA